MPNNLLLLNVRPWGGPAVDVLVRDGIIAEMRPGIAPSAAPGAPVEDGRGHLLLPGLVNAHAHIDKNLLGLPWIPNQVPLTRTIRDFGDTERRLRRELRLDTRVQSARQAAESVACGISHIRTHVDIDTDAGLAHWDAVRETREAFRNLLHVQMVAFPQSGMLVRPGTLELLEEAVRSGGADAIGGLDPSTVDRDPAAHLDAIFGIAERYGVEVDIHLHEPGTLGAFAVELIAERTTALGLQGRVTISHCFCLGQVEEHYLARLIDLLLGARITIMSLGSGAGTFPPLARLKAAGVPLCTGTDGVRDTWGPFNRVDLLDKVRLLGWRLNARRDEEIEALLQIATADGAARMGDTSYGLAVGKRADFFTAPGVTPAQVVQDQPARTLVVKHGRVVARDGHLWEKPPST